MGIIHMPDGSIIGVPDVPPEKHSHDSDWFYGRCPCTDYPCKLAIAAQKWSEAREARRAKLIKVYYDHHGDWPQAAFIDAVIAAEDAP